MAVAWLGVLWRAHQLLLPLLLLHLMMLPAQPVLAASWPVAARTAEQAGARLVTAAAQRPTKETHHGIDRINVNMTAGSRLSQNRGVTNMASQD